MAQPKNPPVAKVRLSDNWISVEESPESSIEILHEFTVKDIKAEGYRLSNQVKLNSNGTPYLLCIDETMGKKAALYMFKAFASNVKENQLLRADEVAIYHVTSTNDEGVEEKGLIIGAPDFKGGVSFF